MDKTVKLRAYSAGAKHEAAKDTQTKDQNLSQELAKSNARLEEEKKKSAEHLKTIEQLRESLKLEQARTAEMVKKKSDMESKAIELATLDANEIVKKTALLDEEKSKSLESMKLIAQLRESLKLEQARAAELVRRTADAESKVKELTDVLNKISKVAAAGRFPGN